MGHVGIVVETDTGEYDSADYGRYGDDVEESMSSSASPFGHGTFITRWFYNPDEKYTFMINPEYIDPVKAVAAYNDQIKNNGYTQIPMEETANFFREVRLKDGNSEEVKEQNEHAKKLTKTLSITEITRLIIISLRITVQLRQQFLSCRESLLTS